MKFRTIIIGSAWLVLVLFAILNWDVFSHSTMLNVMVEKINAPLGVILLLVIGVFTLIYAASLARLEIEVATKVRQIEADMDHLRRIADQSEESRAQALQEFLIRETKRIDVKLDMLLDSTRYCDAVTQTHTDALQRPHVSEKTRAL